MENNKCEEFKILLTTLQNKFDEVENEVIKRHFQTLESTLRFHQIKMTASCFQTALNMIQHPNSTWFTIVELQDFGREFCSDIDCQKIHKKIRKLTHDMIDAKYQMWDSFLNDRSDLLITHGPKMLTNTQYFELLQEMITQTYNWKIVRAIVE
jgi:hypothetical protein